MARLTHALMALFLGLASMAAASPAVVAIQEPRSAAVVQDGLKCGLYSTADKHDFMDMQSTWGVHKDDMCTTPAKTCRRHACKNTSGIYICNDNTVELKNNCTVFHSLATTIGTQCCTKDYTKSKGISGQLWGDNKFNVIVAYANCGHSTDGDNPAMGPKEDPWGPNGECQNK